MKTSCLSLLPPERSRNFVSFAHGYSSNILTVPQIQAYACKHATPSFAVRLRLYASLSNGDGEIRTLDPLLARQVLSQLSYTPILDYSNGLYTLMGLSGLEPPTSRLSGVRSNQLSYKPFCFRKFFIYSGSHLLSHTVSSAVPSAAWVLTIVFGMGTGVSPKRIATRNL